MIQHTAVATLHTTQGDIRVNLFGNQAPKTVRNFIGLATGETEWTDPRTGRPGSGPLYVNVPFHRIIAGFMIQGGDPTGTGAGGPGYSIRDEFHPELRHDRPGVLSMANRGPNTGGSQFFITHVATPWLDDRHAVFGEVVEGMEVVTALRERDPQSASEPGDAIERVEIEESPRE